MISLTPLNSLERIEEKHAAFLKARTEIKDYMKAFVAERF
jgi:hypothetical protein